MRRGLENGPDQHSCIHFLAPDVTLVLEEPLPFLAMLAMAGARATDDGDCDGTA